MWAVRLLADANVQRLVANTVAYNTAISACRGNARSSV